MADTPLLKLGTRSSPLAMAQAHETRARLCVAHGWPESAIALIPVLASGDKIQDRPLADIGGKALWTKELDLWLADGSIDAAVHSLKDVETLRPAELAIAAVLPREDKRDVLIGAASLADLPSGAIIGTSAPRRAAQALHARPDCRIVSFRGNVATRLARLEQGEAHATFLAAAGLRRLGHPLAEHPGDEGTGHALAAADWLPAPSQGAIAIECRADDATTPALLAAIDHAPSRAEAMAERALLAALGGNCHSPIAVLCDLDGDHLQLRAALFSPDGTDRVEASARFAVSDGLAPARLAEELLARATPAIAENFSGPAVA
ncbi:hydroxymethylbilane synthase [Altererythrobacter xixiisoli]|uniref:Porphobilinogen deaminase n=1 Tax=Croceibacterium xixiisoli TaxID=1476466 RepID=A0A6I4TVI2_9SPHN|nr:hydroxymethylbilane synthase [Croceibacterium xixiisoli]MXO99250.1 hydroxymethylbilane synthase [Croceibacterium xixiisoli]